MKKLKQASDLRRYSGLHKQKWESVLKDDDDGDEEKAEQTPIDVRALQV